MSFVVERVRSAWAHVALCADVTWAAQPQDDFIVANQRLWNQHVRITKALQDLSKDEPLQHNACVKYKSTDENAESAAQSSSSRTAGASSSSQANRRSVKDVIPESRLARHYGTFYYDDYREKRYRDQSEQTAGVTNGQGHEISEVTECWMLPEVEYWLQKLTDEPTNQRPTRFTLDDEFERWGPQSGDPGEAELRARVASVRGLWVTNRTPSTPRKMRTRRRTPRRAPHRTTNISPVFSPEAPNLICDPNLKFHFDPPKHQLSPHVQDFISRIPLPRIQTYSHIVKNKQVPLPFEESQQLIRMTSNPWPKVKTEDITLPPIEPVAGTSYQSDQNTIAEGASTSREAGVATYAEKTKETHQLALPVIDNPKSTSVVLTSSEFHKKDQTYSTCKSPEDQVPSTSKTEDEMASIIEIPEDAMASTSATAQELANSRNRRLYSTVLSTVPNLPLNLATVNRLCMQKLVSQSGLLKLNPKIAFPVSTRRPLDKKFEELERQALDQYKASDESIDRKFNDLENQAMDQYSGTSNSNSNTSCSHTSSQSALSKGPSQQCIRLPPIDDENQNLPEENTVDSVVIYSQNHPDFASRSCTSSMIDLKNLKSPLRGEKPNHRVAKNWRCNKHAQRVSSVNDCREGKKAPMRWTLHMIPPKKRHLSVCTSDMSSDDEKDQQAVRKKDLQCIKMPTSVQVESKAKMSAHGGGDLPNVRKS